MSSVSTNSDRKFVVFDIQIEVWKNEHIFNLFPDNSCHLITDQPTMVLFWRWLELLGLVFQFSFFLLANTLDLVLRFYYFCQLSGYNLRLPSPLGKVSFSYPQEV